MMESITVINKSGKVVSTGKHLVNIFKEAKEAYVEKKAALHAEHHKRIRESSNQKLMRAREETQSIASSRHSRSSSHRSHRHGDGERHKGKDKERTSRPPLTERNLTMVSEGSVTSSRSRRSHRSHSHHADHRTPRSPTSPRAGPSGYRAPYLENAEMSTPSLVRRHTEHPGSPRSPQGPTATQLTRSTLPPPYTSQVTRRVASVPDLHAQDEERIDMNLAYGSLPPELGTPNSPQEARKQEELAMTMSKLDSLLLEAQCLQHSATAIIANLQANPEKMAAVALTLAELSNLLAKMSPGILTAIKGSSPAIFALLASPQFLIAGGVAIGVTVVMFGGFKIIKKIQANAVAAKEANKVEEALVYDEIELNSIDTWRRGIAEVEAQSVATSADGEFITPEALRQRKERIRERAKEERIAEEGSVRGSVRSERTIRRADTAPIVPRKDHPVREVPPRGSSSKIISPVSESGRSHRSSKEKGKGKEVLMLTEGEQKIKKSGTFSALFRKGKDKDRSGRESEVSHRPKIVDL